MTREILRITARDWKFPLSEIAGIIRGLNENPLIDVSLECDDNGNPEAVVLQWKKLVEKIVPESEIRSRDEAKCHLFPKAACSEQQIIEICEVRGMELIGESSAFWVLRKPEKGMGEMRA